MFTLLKISWVDARVRLIAVWKTDFLTVSVMEFSDCPALTIWVTYTFKATLIYIKPRKIMEILMVSSLLDFKWGRVWKAHLKLYRMKWIHISTTPLRKM